MALTEPTAEARLVTSTRSRPTPPGPGCRHVLLATNSTQGYLHIRGAILRELLSIGYRVTLLAPFDEATPALTAMGADCVDLDLDLYRLDPFHLATAYRRVRRIYDRLRPDIAFHYTIKVNVLGSRAAASLGIPSVIVVPGLGMFPDLSNPLARWAAGRAYASAARRASEVWFVNQHDFGFFASRGWLRGVRTRVLPGEGVDTARFALRPLPTSKVPTVLFVGRLLVSKGVRVFAEAARIARERGLAARFMVVGFLQRQHPDALEPRELRAWVNEGILSYEGSTEDVRPFLERADVIVLPTFFREGLSCTLQEAMSTGRPVITTARPGTGELVDHYRTGYIVPAREATPIVDALERHFALPRAQRERMGQAARAKVVRDYDASLVHQHYYDVLAGVQADAA